MISCDGPSSSSRYMQKLREEEFRTYRERLADFLKPLPDFQKSGIEWTDFLALKHAEIKTISLTVPSPTVLIGFYNGLASPKLVYVVGINARGETGCASQNSREALAMADALHAAFPHDQTHNTKIAYLASLADYYAERTSLNACVWLTDPVRPLANIQKSAEARYFQLLGDSRA